MPDQTLNDGLPQALLDYLRDLLGADALTAMNVKELKSAQQRVWILENIETSKGCLSSKWKRALQFGNNRLIARGWQASSCWWNLNRNQPRDRIGPPNDEVEVLARSEVAGYRIAHQAIPQIHIPIVLHFSLDDVVSATDSQPWAILTYVGNESTLFDHECQIDSAWMDGMVKSRFEFGFEEPHPRWGRVPEDECVNYTLSVVRHVMFPLHRYFREHQCHDTENVKTLRKPVGENSGFTYASMVRLYREEQHKMKVSLMNSNDKKLMAANGALELAVDRLTKQQPYSDEPLKPFVVCHMDCQPQNLLFAQPAGIEGELSLPRISSVFDWEEAALADPRFEVLLLCRKVCANRDQAEHIWKIYEQEFDDINLGPLAPWLALETVHSITSLLLQSMNLLGGGRSPWESKPDLWGKIQREIRRLVLEHSWEFCDIHEFQ